MIPREPKCSEWLAFRLWRTVPLKESAHMPSDHANDPLTEDVKALTAVNPLIQLAKHTKRH